MIKTERKRKAIMIETEIKEIITHFVTWDEISVLISEHVLEKYKIEIPESAQVRVLNKKDVMVDPDRLRIRYEKDVS